MTDTHIYTGFIWIHVIRANTNKINYDWVINLMSNFNNFFFCSIVFYKKKHCNLDLIDFLLHHKLSKFWKKRHGYFEVEEQSMLHVSEKGVVYNCGCRLEMIYIQLIADMEPIRNESMTVETKFFYMMF